MTEIRSVMDMRRAAADFVGRLSPREHGATVVGLVGDLGAGKTTFVQGAAAALGIIEGVTSPTFILMKFYKLRKPARFDELIHVDAYRLDGGEDLRRLGWDEYASTPGNLILVEWPERVADIMPADGHYVRFDHVDEGTRTIVFDEKR